MRKKYFICLKKKLEKFYFRITESGITEGLNNVTSRLKPNKKPVATMTEVTAEEKDLLLHQKESSHEYD